MPLVAWKSSSTIRVLLRTLALVTLSQTWASPAVSDDWPFFRGPQRRGISVESGWTEVWPAAGPTIAWRKNVGIGASSFVVAGHRVITMGNRDDSDSVWCLDADSGRVLWKFTYPCKFDDHNFEGGTSSTPTIAESSVYTLAYDGQVHCLDLETGQIRWRRHLVEDFSGRYSSWDYAGSPLVVGDLVIFDTGADGDSTVALDKASGKKVWGNGQDLAGYATPIPFEHNGESGVLVFKARAMVAHETLTGQELWRINWKTNYDVNASTPSVIGDKIFISTGYRGRRARGALFKLEDPAPRQLWVNSEIQTKMNSAVVYGGHVYCISERGDGQLMCVDLQSGKTVWVERRYSRYGTLMVANGKLVILDELGELVIAAASAEGYREAARAKVLDERCWSMPVLANGRIYARSNKGSTVCLDLRPN